MRTDDDMEDPSTKKLSFLQKLLHIIATSPPDVVSWADDGLSFFVQDEDRWVDAQCLRSRMPIVRFGLPYDFFR